MHTFAFQDVILVFIGRKKAKSWGIITRYLKKQKSLIQHYERSELRFHFEWTKVYQKCQKWSILAWDLRSISATRQVNINRTKIGGKCQNICFFTWRFRDNLGAFYKVWVSQNVSCELKTKSLVNSYWKSHPNGKDTLVNR